MSPGCSGDILNLPTGFSVYLLYGLYARYGGIVSNLLEEMKSEEYESVSDILTESSRVLIEIFYEYLQEDCLEHIRLLTLEDYFSEKVTGSYAIQTIRNAWEPAVLSWIFRNAIMKSDTMRVRSGRHINPGSGW